MQTRNPGLRALTLALAGVLTLGLAACEETKTVTPQTPTTVTISPSGTVDLEVGDRVTVVANVNNADNAAVTWASSNGAVATVDGNGTVDRRCAGHRHHHRDRRGPSGRRQPGARRSRDLGRSRSDR